MKFTVGDSVLVTDSMKRKFPHIWYFEQVGQVKKVEPMAHFPYSVGFPANEFGFYFEDSEIDPASISKEEALDLALSHSVTDGPCKWCQYLWINGEYQAVKEHYDKEKFKNV